MRFAAMLLICIGLLFVSFFGIWAIKEDEVEANLWHKSECRLLTFDKERAGADIARQLNEQQGLMWCFCEEQFNELGNEALSLTFDDG